MMPQPIGAATLFRIDALSTMTIARSAGEHFCRADRNHLCRASCDHLVRSAIPRSIDADRDTACAPAQRDRAIVLRAPKQPSSINRLPG